MVGRPAEHDKWKFRERADLTIQPVAGPKFGKFGFTLGYVAGTTETIGGRVARLRTARKIKSANELAALVAAKVEDLEQRVRDAEEARRTLEQRPERLQALIEPNSTPQEKKAVLQRYIQRVEVLPGDPEPYIVA